MRATRARDASTMQVTTYQSTQHHNPADRNLNSVDTILYKQMMMQLQVDKDIIFQAF